MEVILDIVGYWELATATQVSDKGHQLNRRFNQFDGDVLEFIYVVQN